MHTTYPFFLPCATGTEHLLSAEAIRILHTPSHPAPAIRTLRAGIAMRGSWHDMLLLNLYSRLAQRVLIEVAHQPYSSEDDLYACTRSVRWHDWFGNTQTFKIDLTAQRSPLKSLQFAALRIKDAIADHFRHHTGSRPSVDTQRPQVRIFCHLSPEHITLYIDTSGEPLFKRGWRDDKGDAPLKETLAAAMIAASGWQPDSGQPLYDPCCGSGTIAIEAAQMACHIAPGLQRRFAFERLLPHQASARGLWQDIRNQAISQQRIPPNPFIFGSDVAHRMVDFAQRNAQRAGVAAAIQLRGGDALQRMPPSADAGVLLLNPPYGTRIATAGIARTDRHGRHTYHPASIGRESAQLNTPQIGDFFARLASHWKAHYAGWSAWILSPDRQLPRHMRLRESRKIPLWNGPIECRLFRFDIVSGRMERTSH